MNKKLKVTISILVVVAIIVAILLYFFTLDIDVLNPKGWVGVKERNLMIVAIALMLVIVIPVFILTAYIYTKFTAKNTKAKYSPEWDMHHVLEMVWWGFPFVIVFILSIITWKACHELDPFKPLAHEKKEMRIQVVALDWKWLFIYPEQKIATVNYVQFPESTPIYFEITADAPMNSFWIPSLGGQIYAMAGMRSKIYLIANEPGSFQGMSANLSGAGFSGMRFVAHASTDAEFERWVEDVQQSNKVLNQEEYDLLMLQSAYNPVVLYTLGQENLFDSIINKYMVPKK